MPIRYKFLRNGMKSESGLLPPWEIGEWRKHVGRIDMCAAGFHCSRGIYQAFSYVQGEVLAQVEAKGKHYTREDKEVWQSMRIVKAWKWQQKDSVLFACFAARHVLKHYEDAYPNDDRIRKAIEAAEACALDPTDTNKKAAARAEARGAARP